jgi:CheY-like chemotaxis protein
MARILVVEDEQDNRALLRLTLELHEHEVIEAATGEDGLVRAAESRPDLILMDISLPGVIDGLEATRRLRADPTFASVPILALTALVMQSDRSNALEAGFDDYMTKPIADLEEILLVVERYVEQGRRRQD